MLIIADHASNLVPPGIDLSVPTRLLDEHVAVDIGTDALARRLSARLDAPAVIAGVSRLVVDLNRAETSADVIPTTSDGHAVPGNHCLTEAARAARVRGIHAPYHAAIERVIAAQDIALLIAVHSFTPRLTSRPDVERPWAVGLLYNRDDRAARVAIAHLRGQGLIVGDNEPYSGRTLNYTMDRHAEARGLPYLAFEVRQDLLESAEQIDHWAERLSETAIKALAASAMMDAVA